MVEPIDEDILHKSYKQISDLIGMDNMLILYNNFRGDQINFPMKLYDRDAVKRRVKKEYDGKNLPVLSQKYGYTQRWIRNIINDRNI